MPVPDLQTNPAYDAQAVPDSTDWSNVTAGLNGTGVISGCVVSALASPSMTIQMSAGSVAVSDAIYAIAAASITIASASSSDRRDIITVNTSAIPSATQGTPCGTATWTRTTYPGLPPVKPILAANTALLAEVYVAGGVSSITNADILNSAAITPTVQTIQGLTGDLIFYSPNSTVSITTSGASVGFTATGGGGGGSVNSVFGRTGSVVASVGDYAGFYDANGKAATASVAVLAETLALSGGTMAGNIAMGTNAITGITQETNVVASVAVVAGAVTIAAAANRQNRITVSATTAITMSTTNLADGIMALVVILDGGSTETLSWVNTENSLSSAPLISKGSTTLPTYVLFRANGSTSKWACVGVT